MSEVLHRHDGDDPPVEARFQTVTPICWTAFPKPACFAHLGKFGDLMVMFPAFKAVRDATGTPPVCIVAEEFASIFDGISYARPWKMRLNWWQDVGKARAMGEARYGHCIVPKYWDEPGVKEPFKLNDEPTVVLDLHGRKLTVPASEWDSYQLSQWRYAGFTMQQFWDWPLVFDRRNAGREEQLRKDVFHVVNFQAASPETVTENPCGQHVDVEHFPHGIVQMRQTGERETTELFELSRQVHEAVEAIASAQQRGASEDELSKLRARLFETRQAEKAAMPEMRQPEQPNAPRGLQPSAPRPMALPQAPSRNREGKPKLLVNLNPTGTSPFYGVNEVVPLLHQTGLEIVDLGNVRAERIYDLLGLYDHAAGLVTTDTATLHLAAASSIPYIAFVNNGGAGSVPKGNCILKVRYGQVGQNLSQISQALEKISA